MTGHTGILSLYPLFIEHSDSKIPGVTHTPWSSCRPYSVGLCWERIAPFVHSAPGGSVFRQTPPRNRQFGLEAAAFHDGTLSSGTACPAGAGRPHLHCAGRRDRKSTRLNSSHVSI